MTYSLISVILKSVIKDRFFVKDDQTGCYGMNMPDGNYLFQYNPDNMILRMSYDTVYKYFLYRKVDMTETLLLKDIAKNMYDLTGIKFKSTFISKSNMIYDYKYFDFKSAINKLKNSTIRTDVLSLPTYMPITDVSLRFDKNIEDRKYESGKMFAKFYYNGFDNLNIKSLNNGYYILIINIKNEEEPVKARILIDKV